MSGRSRKNRRERERASLPDPYWVTPQEYLSGRDVTLWTEFEIEYDPDYRAEFPAISLAEEREGERAFGAWLPWRIPGEKNRPRRGKEVSRAP